MDNEANKISGDETQPQSETPQKHVATIIAKIAVCASVTFAVGAFLEAPWPGAVASCGLSLMGVGVAIVMLRRG
jgi:hypothetical protein